MVLSDRMTNAEVRTNIPWIRHEYFTTFVFTSSQAGGMEFTVLSMAGGETDEMEPQMKLSPPSKGPVIRPNTDEVATGAGHRTLSKLDAAGKPAASLVASTPEATVTKIMTSDNSTIPVLQPTILNTHIGGMHPQEPPKVSVGGFPGTALI